MVDYLYRCPEGHETTHPAAMGDAAPRTPCHCGEDARRAFTAPMLGGARRATHTAIERAQASAEYPGVVRSTPTVSAPVAPTDPRHAMLPRP